MTAPMSVRKHTRKRTQPAQPAPTNTADKKPHITIPDFLEVLSAMHFASMVPAPVQDACGLMLIAPSGSLKSQLLMHLQRAYPNNCICDSNWHYGKLLSMRDAFYNGMVRSIVIPELAAVYSGDPRTGGRMEAMLQQMAGEGSITTNEKDSRWERYEMRASVFAAMTPDFARRKHPFWTEGFHRRFLWAHMAMENEEVLLDYLTAGRQADLHVVPIVEPPEKFIPDTLDYKDKRSVRDLLQEQTDFGPNHTRFSFLCRTSAVLKWHYQRIGNGRNWLATMRRFSVLLSDRAALLIVPDEPTAMKYRKKKEADALTEGRKLSHKKTRKRKKLQPQPEVKVNGATAGIDHPTDA